MHGRVAEVCDQNTRQVVVIFHQQDVRGTVSVVENAAKLGEQKIFIEGLLHPALRIAGELGTQCRRENTQHDYGNFGGRRIVAKPLKRLPPTEAGHVKVEQDGFDRVLRGKFEGLLAAGWLRRRV